MLGKKTRSVVGLDIEPGFMAAAEFSNGGTPTLQRAATSALVPGLFHEGEVADVDGLADQLRGFFRDNDLPKVVRLGVASQKVVVRVIELPDIEGEEALEAAVRFQAQEELPMPLEQATLDHRVLEKFTDGENTRIRVLMVAARRETVDHLLAAARKAGLDPQLVDLSAFAIVRALYVPPNGNGAAPANGAHEPSEAASARAAQPEPIAGEPVASDPVEPVQAELPAELSGDQSDPLGESGDVEPPADAPIEISPPEMLEPIAEMPEPGASSASDTATLYCHVGGLTNLAIANGTECVFSRVLQVGAESMAASLAERKALTLEHARQWINHVALEKDIDSIEGEREIVTAAREVLDSGVGKIAEEVRMSLEYYQGSVPNARSVDRVVLAGQAIALAGFSAALQRGVGLTVEPRSLGALEVKPGALDGVDGAQLTVAAGLAIDEVKP